jgi:hypothetical protein
MTPVRQLGRQVPHGLASDHKKTLNVERKEGFPKFIKTEQQMRGCMYRNAYGSLIRSYGLKLSEKEIDRLWNLGVHHKTIQELAWDVQGLK